LHWIFQLFGVQSVVEKKKKEKKGGHEAVGLLLVRWFGSWAPLDKGFESGTGTGTGNKTYENSMHSSIHFTGSRRSRINKRHGYLL
jgi:hypothetical protein